MSKRETEIKMEQVRKNVTQKEDHGKKLRRRSYGKTEMDEEAWLSDNPLEVETS
jgi:hypothetical protein